MTLSNHVPTAGHRPQTRRQRVALRSGLGRGGSVRPRAQKCKRKGQQSGRQRHTGNSAGLPLHTPTGIGLPATAPRQPPIYDRAAPPRGLGLRGHYAATPHPRLTAPLPARGTGALSGLWPGLPPGCHGTCHRPPLGLSVPGGTAAGRAEAGPRPRLSQPGARLLR